MPAAVSLLLSRAPQPGSNRGGGARGVSTARRPQRCRSRQHPPIPGTSPHPLPPLPRSPQSVRSLEGTVGGDAEGATLGDTVEDESALDADEASLMAGLRDDMAKLLERLPAREAAVMRMRYGLDGEVYTLDDIGRLLKVRRGRSRAGAAGGYRLLRSSWLAGSVSRGPRRAARASPVRPLSLARSPVSACARSRQRRCARCAPTWARWRRTSGSTVTRASPTRGSRRARPEAPRRPRQRP